MASVFVDPLCCEEDHWDVVEHFAEPPPSPATEEPAEDDGEWSQFLSSLVSREVQLDGDDEENREYASARAAAARWAARARAAHGFSAATLFLALSYLDRCFAGGGGAVLKLRRDRPWMGRLAAVACVSLAAKVEETWVPHPLDLQSSAAADTVSVAGDEDYFFEAKTIRRMELLVLSALQWRMNSVTPLTLVHHLIPKTFPNIFPKRGYLLQASEFALLSVLLDWRWVKYKPSLWAAAALLHAAAGYGDGAVEFEDARQYLTSMLNISKEEVEECYRIISEAMSNTNKRKNNESIDPYYGNNVTFNSYPRSPDGVLSSCFSSESSSTSINGDIWPCSVTSSPQHPLHKKPRTMEIK